MPARHSRSNARHERRSRHHGMLVPHALRHAPITNRHPNRRATRSDCPLVAHWCNDDSEEHLERITRVLRCHGPRMAR
jgi:hypothetical protein